jgi:hypothetical protein
VQIVRVPDCAVADDAGAVVDLEVKVTDLWPKLSAVLGAGSSTVAGLSAMFRREIEATGSINVTIMGDWTNMSPCQGLRDVVLAAGYQHTTHQQAGMAQARSTSRVVLISDSDYMCIKASSAVVHSASVNAPNTLAKVPADFGAVLSRVSLNPRKVVTWLCGVPPAQLLRLPPSPGLL